MEELNWENEIQNRKKAYEEGIKQRVSECEETGGIDTENIRKECLKYYKLYREGQITATELGDITAKLKEWGK
jgi:hypothetical protein